MLICAKCLCEKNVLIICTMLTLNAKDIVAAQAKKTTRRHESFKKILEQCNKQIKKSVEIERNITFTFFEVPEFLIGYPLFDLNECIEYLLKTLTTSGFAVKYFFPRIIFVSWGSPLPPPPPPPKKIQNSSLTFNNNNNKKIIQTTKKKSGKFILNF